MAKKTLPVRVTLPASIEEAVDSLNGLAALLTATEWERAAIVYTFTHNDGPGQPTKYSRLRGNTLSMAAFAAKRINGLKTEDAVAHYRKAWEDHGDKDIKPGDDVELPVGKDFPSMSKNIGSRISGNPERLVEQILEKGIELAEAEGKKQDTGYVAAVFDLLKTHVDSTRLTVDPPPVSMAGSSITSDVTQHFVGAARHIEKAVARLNDAITYGTRFESEEFETLAHEPEWRLDPELLVYRKTVAMVVTHEVEV